MKARIATLAGGLALASSMFFVGATSVAAAGSTAGPAGTGVCSVQATAALKLPDVDDLRAFGDCEINRRMVTLGKLTSFIAGSKVMTSSDKSSLNSEIASTESGLTSLKATIDSETSIPALRADIVKIATEFRVYLLVAPQVDLVNGADGVLAAQTHFSKVNTNLAARIAAAKAAGKDTTTAQADLDAMNAQVANAVSLATGLPAELLPLTPAEYNAGPGKTTLQNARTALLQARSDLKAAVADAEACRAALLALK